MPIDSSSSPKSSPEFISDGELAAGIQARDIRALREIYQRHSSLVYTLALKILNNATEAEDLTQDIFLKLWHHQSYNPQRGSLPSYLATLTRSRALDRLRVNSNRHHIISQWRNILGPSFLDPPPMERATWRDRQMQIQAALSTLPEQHRTVLELSYFQGMSQSAIAAHLDRPLGTVKSWARKGLLQLRDYYQTHNIEP